MKFKDYLSLKLHAEFFGKKILGANGKPFVVEYIEISEGIDPAIEIEFRSKRNLHMIEVHQQYWRGIAKDSDYATPAWMKADQTSSIYAEQSYSCCHGDMPEVVE